MKKQNTEGLPDLRSNLVSICDRYLCHCQVGLEEKRKDALVLVKLVPQEEISLIINAIKVFEEWIQFVIETKSLMLESSTHKELVSIFNEFLKTADETSSKFDEIDEELMSNQ